MRSSTFLTGIFHGMWVSSMCVLEMVGFAFFVFFSRELFGTSSLGHLESISSIGTKKSCTHVWHGPFKVLVIKLCNREGG